MREQSEVCCIEFGSNLCEFCVVKRWAERFGQRLADLLEAEAIDIGEAQFGSLVDRFVERELVQAICCHSEAPAQRFRDTGGGIEPAGWQRGGLQVSEDELDCGQVEREDLFVGEHGGIVTDGAVEDSPPAVIPDPGQGIVSIFAFEGIGELVGRQVRFLAIDAHENANPVSRIGFFDPEELVRVPEVFSSENGIDGMCGVIQLDDDVFPCFPV